MTETNEGSSQPRKASLRISLDGWAVALAIAVSLLVWLGWIKHVPW